MELIVTDQTKNKRICFSSSVKEIEKKQCNLLIPTQKIIPANKWMNLQIDCASFLDSSSNSESRFKSLEAIIISAPCRIRRIFTSKNSLPNNFIEGYHSEDIPKIFSFPSDIESDNILVSLSSVTEITRQKNQFMADTFNSKFRDSSSGLESLETSTNGNNLALQKNQSSQSDGKTHKIKKPFCDIIQELPLLQQQKRLQNNSRDLSTPKILKQGINQNMIKYPLPPSSTSPHVKQQHGNYQPRHYIVSQEEDTQEFQTTGTSDIRGSVNTIFSGKFRIATSPHDASSSSSFNQLQNASSSTLNSTAASKGLRLNSRLGNHTPLSTHKLNNFNGFCAQSKSPTIINSAATTTNSAAKSNPWSINKLKASKVNYISVDGKSESSDNVSGVKRFPSLTPERPQQSLKVQGDYQYANIKARDEKQTVVMQKQIQQNSQKNNISPKKIRISQERLTPPPCQNQIKQEGSKKYPQYNRNQLKEIEQFVDIAQKYSNLADPKLFQNEPSKEKDKCSLMKGGKVRKQKYLPQIKTKDNKNANSLKQQQLQCKDQHITTNNIRNKSSSSYYEGEEDEYIEEIIETEFTQNDCFDTQECNKNDYYSMDNHHFSGSKNKHLISVGNGQMNKYQIQIGTQENQEQNNATDNNGNDQTAMKQANLNKTGMNQNSTGLSFTKPNLIVKKQQSESNELSKTGQQIQSHIKPQQEEEREENNRIYTLEVFQSQNDKRIQKSDGKKKKNNQLFMQFQLPDIGDEQTIPDADTLKQSQTNFFKEYMNAITASIRPFTPPFNQLENVIVSSSNQSTLSISKKVKEMDQSDHQIEVIYDDVLNCYYDPKTNQYFELKS